MFIFGWGRTTLWYVGPVFQKLCSNCHNEEFWVLVRRRTWFTLFFIPVIPYETKWTLICPICKYGITLNSEQVKELLPLAETNKLLVDKKITEEEHASRIAALDTAPVKNPEQETIKTIEAEVRDVKASYCGECGIELNQDSKFCTGCGTKITT